MADPLPTYDDLQTALEHERELSDLKSRLVSIVSHEFRTPLAVILTTSEMLERYYDRLTTERREAGFASIRSQIRNLSLLLDDVNVIVRAETGRLEFKPAACDLLALSQTACDEISRSVGSKHQIHLEADGDFAHISVDGDLLSHALRNLLANACKFSPPGSVVTLRLQRPAPDMVEILVRDQGIGIPAAEQERIFEPYYRASNARGVSGTGLGMKLIRYVVERHSGSIRLDSREGEGTTFTLRLPLAP